MTCPGSLSLQVTGTMGPAPARAWIPSPSLLPSAAFSPVRSAAATGRPSFS